MTLDNTPVWVLSGTSVTPGSMQDSGLIPVGEFSAGLHQLRLALHGVGTSPFSFEVSNIRVTTGTAVSGVPALFLLSTHSGNFTQGQAGATYSITIGNAFGGVPISGLVTVTETVPAGMTLISMNGGSMWNCTALPNCTTYNALDSGSSYPAIVVSVSVAGNASASVINQATVTVGTQTATASDPTSIIPVSCGVNGHQAANVADLQFLINEALGVNAPVDDMNSDGFVNVVDVQKAMNVVVGIGCF